jgi:hypothetical protein
MNEHGAKLPPPNTSGHGEVFNTSGINTNTPQFQSAVQACLTDLLAILEAGSGHSIPGIRVTRR